MARILATGIATLDIVNEVETYPQEDDEVRALSQRISRGGNASNTLDVLSQLGHRSFLAAVLIHEADGRILEANLSRAQINTLHCSRMAEGKMPTSYITLNRQNGSRTIVHHRQCPEYGFAAFQQIDLTLFDWLHFEGRNINELTKMLEHCHRMVPTVPISLEVEKPREGIENLFEKVDWLFFSRPYVVSRGYQSVRSLFAQLPTHVTATCTWGAQGAYGWRDGHIIRSAGDKLEQVVDSLGAGDTFNAAMIHSQLKNLSLTESLQFSCQLAAKKCQQYGFENLVKQL